VHHWTNLDDSSTWIQSRSRAAHYQPPSRDRPSALCPATSEALAGAAGIAIMDTSILIDVERLIELENIQAFAFSACTFEIHQRRIIVTNPLRSGGRHNSDVAHELSHVLLEHDLAEVRDVGGMFFRGCEPDEEEEATSLGGTLLLPRALLLKAAAKGWGVEELVEHCGVTTEMARYRLNTKGGSQTGRRS
jgi:Zn-dependent peptidase ImmA (M78 family)